MTFRAFYRAAAAMFSLLAFSAHAEDTKPVEWVVAYAAGGGSDVVARTLGNAMAQTLKQSIIINNKPGGATNIAADYVAKSRDPEHMMFTADFATLAANPNLFAKLSFDPEKDFTPVGMLVRFPMLLVVASNVPANDFKEFVAWAKTNKEAASYGSAGAGSPHHLAGELLRERTGLNLQHVPYRGAAPAVQDLMGGQIPLMMVDTASVIQYVKSGKVKAIGVASPSRLKSLPDVPTLAEQGLPGFEAYAWQGLVVPSATSPAIVARLNKALNEALTSADVQNKLEALALEPLPGTPKQMADYARSERERWGKLIRANNIRLD